MNTISSAFASYRRILLTLALSYRANLTRESLQPDGLHGAATNGFKG